MTEPARVHATPVVILIENEHHRVQEFWRCLIGPDGAARHAVLDAPELALPADLTPYVIFVPSPDQEGQVAALRRELATDRILHDARGFWDSTILFDLLDRVVSAHPGGRFLILWDDHLNAAYTSSSDGMSLQLAQQYMPRLRARIGAPDVVIWGISAHGSPSAHTQQIVESVQENTIGGYYDRANLDRRIARFFARPRPRRRHVIGRIDGRELPPSALTAHEIDDLRAHIRESVARRLIAAAREHASDPQFIRRCRNTPNDPVHIGGFIFDGAHRKIELLEHVQRDAWYEACLRDRGKRDWPTFYRARLLEAGDLRDLVWSPLPGDVVADPADLHARTFLYIVRRGGWHRSGDLIAAAALEFGSFGDQKGTLRARISKLRDDIGRRELLASDRARGYRCLRDFLLIDVPRAPIAGNG